MDRRFEALRQQALAAYITRQQAFAAAIRPYHRWDLDAGTLSLHFSAGADRLSLAATPIATYVPEAGQWAWAWANDGFSAAARQRAQRLQALAETTGYAIFRTPHFPAQPADIDSLCALALQALEGQAVFKIKDATPWSFYVLHAD